MVELLDLSEVYGWYQDEGSQPYHPKMMLKVLFYSYLTGTMSSRELKQLPGLFAQIVHLCMKLGMIHFKYLAIDGQKIRADARAGGAARGSAGWSNR